MNNLNVFTEKQEVIANANLADNSEYIISENLILTAKEILEKNGIKVLISVPKGKELGPKTDNPRIG